MSTYTPIATQTLDSAAPSVIFSSLPQNYTDLIIQVNNQMSGASGIKVRFNSDTGSNYSMTTLQGYGSTASSYRTTNAASIYNNLVYGDSTTANAFTPHIMQIQNYSNSNTYKTMLWRYGSSTQAGGNGDLAAIVGLWRNTSAITSIEISAWNAVNFVAGSTFTIYGIAAGNSSAKATGGNIVTTDGTYWYHTFTSSGTFTPNQALTVDYLVVAGGGSGGTYGAANGSGNGGGGGGGLRSTVTATGGGGTLESAISLSANTTYSAIVGAGAPGMPSGLSTYKRGRSGSNTVFATITSIGGGAGGAATGSSGYEPLTGGSGGGAGYTGSGAAGTANQGYAGGSGGNGNPPYYSGGGGGAGGAGGNAVGSSSAGAGGAGLSVAISGTSITYAAGGAGSSWTTGSSSNATANTGNGSDGSGTGSTGNGGSGIIIVRYAV